eukprot:m.1167034 g.1167034  ORF g.1167034 m.1167034 type:complete len:146 (+) comp24506_c0_seq9:81-518(+)
MEHGIPRSSQLRSRKSQSEFVRELNAHTGHAAQERIAMVDVAAALELEGLNADDFDDEDDESSPSGLHQDVTPNIPKGTIPNSDNIGETASCTATVARLPEVSLSQEAHSAQPTSCDRTNVKDNTEHQGMLCCLPVNSLLRLHIL